MSTGITVDCDFSKGNVVLDDIVDDDALVRQDLSDTQGDRFSWSFRFGHQPRRGPAKTGLTFHSRRRRVDASSNLRKDHS